MALMTIGMMWFDGNHGLPLAERIERAVTYYRTKYGLNPNLLFLHPQTAGDHPLERMGQIEVRTSPSVLPDHFWVGVGRSPEPGEEDALPGESR